MKMPSEIAITFELEPIVKLVCKNTSCRFNLAHARFEEAQIRCSLKHVELGEDGKCERFENASSAPTAPLSEE